MSLVQTLISFLKKKETIESNDTPDGFCPNCWGREEYGGKFYEAVRNHKTDVNSANPNVGWVQDYADKHLSDIQIQQNGDEYVCQKCKVSYRPS